MANFWKSLTTEVKGRVRPSLDRQCCAGRKLMQARIIALNDFLRHQGTITSPLEGTTVIKTASWAKAVSQETVHWVLYLYSQIDQNPEAVPRQTASRTGLSIFNVLWSYVLVLRSSHFIKSLSSQAAAAVPWWSCLRVSRGLHTAQLLVLVAFNHML